MAAPKDCCSARRTSDKSDVTTLALESETTSARPAPSFVSAPPTLNDLAVRYNTDKRIGIHSYVKWYEALFAPRRWQQLNMLEIGVQTGASIKMWADYFPNARLVGIDIDPRCAQFATNRIQIIGRKVARRRVSRRVRHHHR